MADTITTQSKKIPVADGIPLLGSAFTLIKDPLHFFVDQYKKKGSIYRVKYPNNNIIVISGQDGNSFMQKEGAKYLSAVEAWQFFKDSMGVDKMILSSDGKEHFAIRRIINRGFSTEMIRERVPEVIDNMRNTLQQQPVQEDIQLVDFIRRTVAGQLSMLLTNHPSEEYFEDIMRFTHWLLNITMRRWPAFSINLPQFQKSKKKVYELARTVLENHRKNPNPNGKPDFIDDLLAANNDEEFFTEDDLIGVTLSPFIAGVDTVSNTTMFLVYELLKNPEVLERATKEVDALFDAGVPDFNTLRRSKILHAIALETLRLHPIGLAQIRKSKVPFEFNGYRVEAGRDVFVPTVVTHFLPEIFPEPYKYDIDRYAPPRNEHRGASVYAPFGLGPHLCAGNKLSEVMLMTITAALIRYIEFEPLPENHTMKVIFGPLPCLADDSVFRIKKFRDVKC